MPQAVIFDMDGTLVDSNELHVEAWDRAFRKFGKTFPREKLRSQIGKGSDQYLPEFLTPDEINAIGKQLDEYRSEFFKKEMLPRVRPFPKVRDLFLRIRAERKKIALASSGKGQEVDVYKNICDIEDLIDAQITSDDADSSKPAPDVFEASLTKLKVDAAQAIAVGDTFFDAESASRTGVATVGLLCGGSSEARLRNAGMIAIYQDPADLLVRYSSSPLAD
jgi:phosphoglycolate phosphatase-like HAD superfamily hydrolase